VVGIRLYIMRIKKMLYKNTGKLFCHKEAWNYVLLRKMNGNGDHHVKWNKPGS
jgi:hypothetical protein